MYVDSQTRISNAQALTATAVGTNVIPLGVARSIGNGEPLGMVFVVNVDADQTTGDEDYTFELEYSSAEDQSSGYKTMGRRLFESGTPAAPAENADLLVAGFKFVIPMPPTGASEDEAYIGVRYTLAGTSPTITVTAYLSPLSMVDQHVIMADGYEIS